MRGNRIEAGDTSARTVTHEELGRNIEQLIEDCFISEPTKYIDQEEDYSLLAE